MLRDGFTYGLVEKRGKPLSLLSLLSDITLSRIEAIVERGNCIKGVMTALESEDYESAEVRTEVSPDRCTVQGFWF
ncbi:unnamed protein product [Brassica rapa subsp. trilocularis]